METQDTQEVFETFAEEYPEFVKTYTDGSKYFDIAALMRSKGHIE